MILLLGLQILNVASHLHNASVTNTTSFLATLKSNINKTQTISKDDTRQFDHRSFPKRVNRAEASWVHYIDDDFHLHTFSSPYIDPFETFDPAPNPVMMVKHTDPYDTIYLSAQPNKNKETQASTVRGRNQNKDFYAGLRDPKPDQNTYSSSSNSLRNGNQKLQKNQGSPSIYNKQRRPIFSKNKGNGVENLKNAFSAEDYVYKTDETPSCVRDSVLPLCDEDNEYPVESIQLAIEREANLMDQLMPESGESIDLVDGLIKYEDVKYNLRHYYKSRSEMSKEVNKSGINQDYYKDGGYICPSLVNYVQPRRAKNTSGMWKIVINLRERFKGAEYKQTIRLEECMHKNAECSFTSNFYNSQCIQKFNNHRLLVWTAEKGIHVDVFRLPIACSCHFKGKL